MVNVAIKFNIHLHILRTKLGHQSVKKGVSDITLQYMVLTY